MNEDSAPVSTPSTLADETMATAAAEQRPAEDILRDKIAQGLRSLRGGKGADGEAFFAGMEAQLGELGGEGGK